MSEIHEYEKDYRRLLERVKSLNILETNKSAMLGFNDYLLSEGIRYARIIKYLYVLIKLINFTTNLLKTPQKPKFARLLEK